MSASEPVAAAEPTQIGRRAFLTRSVVAGAGLIVGPALIAACSGTTASTAPSAGASTAASAAASAAPSAAASAVSAAPSVAASPSAAASAAITPNQATTLKDFKPYVPNPTAGSKPPVPNSFSYFVPSASEYFTGLSDAAKQAAADRKIEYGGMVLSDADPVKNIDQMNTALQKGIGGLWIQPDDSVAQGQIIVKSIPSGVCSWFSGHPATVQAMADQYDLGYQQALGAVDYITKNLGGKATVVSFILDHIEILIPRKEGTRDGLKTGGAGITLIEQELQKITSDEGFQFASTMLQAHPDILVWLGPDDTVLGVDAFLKSKKLDPATNKTLCSGLAGTDAGFAAMKTGTSFFRQSYGFNNNLIGYVTGQNMADWFAGLQIPAVAQGRVIPVLTAADIDAFYALTKDPKSAYPKLIGGDYDTLGLALWGQIDYDHRMNYTANAIT
jgi:ABC-type sugar transport system substrate-binding protein